MYFQLVGLLTTGLKDIFPLKKGNSQHSHRGHQGVEDTDSKGSSTGEGLSEIQFSIRIIIVVIRVDELDIAVVDELSDHGDAGPEASSPALKDNGLAERAGAVTGCRV